jgi:hypothetical protein
MKCPAECYTTSPLCQPARTDIPFHNRDVVITAFGRLEGIWLDSLMHYDLGYFDLEQKTLQPLDNPFGTRLSPMS